MALYGIENIAGFQGRIFMRQIHFIFLAEERYFLLLSLFLSLFACFRNKAFNLFDDVQENLLFIFLSLIQKVK